MRRRWRGSITIATAIWTGMLLSVAALTFDVGMALIERRLAQDIADLAALAVLSVEVDGERARLGEGDVVIDSTTGIAAGCDIVTRHRHIASCTSGMVTFDATTQTSLVSFSFALQPVFAGVITSNPFTIEARAGAALDEEGVPHLVQR